MATRTKTSPKRPTRAFRGAVDGTPFSKENQPAPELKRNGWAKKLHGRELAKAIMNLPFKGQDNSELKKAAAKYYNVPEEEITVEQMMFFRQIEKSIQKADTPAFKVVQERTYGLPKQEVDIMSGGQSLNPFVVITRDEKTKEELEKLR